MTIRRQPADFAVREILTDEFLRSIAPRRDPTGASFAVYEVRKTSLTTPDAARMLAGALRISDRGVGYAGLKDKHAVTWQHMTAALPAHARPPQSLSGRGWHAKLMGWTPVAVDASAIARNRFDIVVRDLTPQAAAEMDRRAALLRSPETSDEAQGSLWIINYFGDQRFGSARHGGGFVARRLIAGDFEGALRLAIATPARKDVGPRRRFTREAAAKWGQWTDLARSLPPCPERRAIERLAAGGSFADAFEALPLFLRTLLIEAYQSHLWNETARRLVQAAAPGDLLAADDPFGRLLFPPAAAIPETLRDLNVPMLAPTTSLRPPWDAAAAAALEAEGISLSDLQIPGAERLFFGEAPRPLVVRAERFTLGEAVPDELAKSSKRLRRLVTFDLPRGAYATVVLRALGQ